MQLSEELSRAFVAMGRHINRGEGAISRPDYLVLARLAARDCTRSRDLAAAEGLDQSTMSRRIASLLERGLVERSVDPSDGRAYTLALTEAGHEAVRTERARRVRSVTDALAGWDAVDRAELARLLGRLTDTLEAQS
ncbi:MAG: MarR family transcriptional regulator [Intrasporangiaceae bacterium]|nr:MarR family transcriptional regulator [Intrasporangiaceae bacterium]